MFNSFHGKIFPGSTTLKVLLTHNKLFFYNTCTHAKVDCSWSVHQCTEGQFRVCKFELEARLPLLHALSFLMRPSLKQSDMQTTLFRHFISVARYFLRSRMHTPQVSAPIDIMSHHAFSRLLFCTQS